MIVIRAGTTEKMSEQVNADGSRWLTPNKSKTPTSIQGKKNSFFLFESVIFLNPLNRYNWCSRLIVVALVGSIISAQSFSYPLRGLLKKYMLLFSFCVRQHWLPHSLWWDY